MTKARSGQYDSIGWLHLDFDLKLRDFFGGTREQGSVPQIIMTELNKWGSADAWWWTHVEYLPTQVERKAQMMKVIERLERDDFDIEAFKTEYEDYYSCTKKGGIFKYFESQDMHPAWPI